MQRVCRTSNSESQAARGGKSASLSRRHATCVRWPFWIASLAILVAIGLARGQDPIVVYEHRVVVATTSLDFEADVEGSLLRNVNRLAALGFEVGAILAGDGPMIDRLLQRKPYRAGHVDHHGHVFVIMHRPYLQPSPVREYRMLHTDTPFGVEKIVARYGSEGFRLTVTAWEGENFHAVFERVADAPPVEYRVFRNERRRGWDRQIQEDPEIRRRLRRVSQMTLDSALVELGEPADPPAEIVWEYDAPHNHHRLQERLTARAAQGFRVQHARMINNTFYVAMLKPAGATGPAPELRLDDGPWGGPCSGGSIRGADIWKDGDVYCVAEDPNGPIRNQGFDLTLRRGPQGDGGILRTWVPCQVRAQLSSSRPAAVRVARALELEHEIQREVKPGFRVTRAFALPREDGEERLVFFTTRLPLSPVNGTPAPNLPAPPLTPQVDGLLQSSLANHEESINERLAAELRELDVIAWVEVYEDRVSPYVRLCGCARIRFDRDHAELVLRRLLMATPYSNYRIRNEISVELSR